MAGIVAQITKANWERKKKQRKYISPDKVRRIDFMTVPNYLTVRNTELELNSEEITFVSNFKD